MRPLSLRILCCAFVWVRILISHSWIIASRYVCAYVRVYVNSGIWQAKDRRLVRHGISIKINSRMHTNKFVPYIASLRGLTGEGSSPLCSALLLLPAVVFSLSCTLAHAWPAMRYEDDEATRHRRQAQVKDLSVTKWWHLRARLRQHRQQQQKAAGWWGKKLKLQQIIKINFNQGGQTKRWPAKSIAHFCAPK